MCFGGVLSCVFVWVFLWVFLWLVLCLCVFVRYNVGVFVWVFFVCFLRPFSCVLLWMFYSRPFASAIIRLFAPEIRLLYVLDRWLGWGLTPPAGPMSPTPMTPRLALMARVHHRLRPQCPCSPNKLKKYIKIYTYICQIYIYIFNML